MALSRTVAPTELPLTLGEVKAHCRADGASSEDDGLLAWYLEKAVDALDGPAGLLGRCLVSQTLAMTLDRFPARSLALPCPPLIAVASIAYVDPDGATQTLASSVYRVLHAGHEMAEGRIALGYDQTWPTIRATEAAVTVTWTAGFGARSAVPWKYRALLLELVRESYDFREPVAEAGLAESPALRRAFTQCAWPAVG